MPTTHKVRLFRFMPQRYCFFLDCARIGAKKCKNNCFWGTNHPATYSNKGCNSSTVTALILWLLVFGGEISLSEEDTPKIPSEDVEEEEGWRDGDISKERGR